jgi:hypothetical protein
VLGVTETKILKVQYFTLFHILQISVIAKIVLWLNEESYRQGILVAVNGILLKHVVFICNIQCFSNNDLRVAMYNEYKWVNLFWKCVSEGWIESEVGSLGLTEIFAVSNNCFYIIFKSCIFMFVESGYSPFCRWMTMAGLPHYFLTLAGIFLYITIPRLSLGPTQLSIH